MAPIKMYNLTTDDVSEVATTGAHALLNFMLKEGAISKEVADDYENVAIIAVGKGWLAKLWEKFQGTTEENVTRLVAVRHHYDRKALPAPAAEEKE